MNLGEVKSFDEQYFLITAQILVDADEAERAYWLLTQGLPAYYRDNPPERISYFRNQIQMAMMTPLAYLDCIDDSLYCEDPERAKTILEGTLRGQLVKASVDEYNKAGKIPHIVEMGPGEYWLPIGLKKTETKFTYQDIAVNEVTRKKSTFLDRTLWREGMRTIFCAQEVIEHLPSVNDMNVELMRATEGHGADEIHLSTPLYTYDSKAKPILELNKNGLPHLRAYTPNEFSIEAMRIFGPAYNWQFYPGQVMSLVGKRK